MRHGLRAECNAVTGGNHEGMKLSEDLWFRTKPLEAAQVTSLATSHMPRNFTDSRQPANSHSGKHTKP
jgi:hypothetical protein